MSVPTVDEDAWRALEPGTAHPLQRLRAVRRLRDAGVNAGVLMAPVVPGFTTQPSQARSDDQGGRRPRRRVHGRQRALPERRHEGPLHGLPRAGVPAAGRAVRAACIRARTRQADYVKAVQGDDRHAPGALRHRPPAHQAARRGRQTSRRRRRRTGRSRAGGLRLEATASTDCVRSRKRCAVYAVAASAYGRQPRDLDLDSAVAHVGRELVALRPALADRQLDARLDHALQEPRAVGQAVAVGRPAARAPPA